MHNFKLNGYLPSKIGFGEGLKLLGHKYNSIVALGADITSSVSLDIFAKEFPDRFFSFGIAEQNIIGVAAGLSLAGKIPFVSTYGVFAALRTTDQIRVSICYNNLHVIIGGAHAGISVGADGATHQALEDIAIMRVLPNMTVLSPCDATQTQMATIAAVEQCKGPVYIRFGREPVPDFTSSDLKFTIGKGQIFKSGKDVSIISTGHLNWEALIAADILENEGISAEVINIHTIKPIDKDIIVDSVKKTGAVVTAEEHQIYGGFGSAVSEVLSKEYPAPVEFIGMADCFGESGSPDELLNKYGMTARHIVIAARKAINRKKSK